MRRNFTARFSQVSDENQALELDVVASNDNHEFFTSVLEDALSQLVNHRETTKPNSPASPPAELHEDIEKLTNLFSVLEVEECDDSAEVLARFAEPEEKHSATRQANKATIPTASKDTPPDVDEVCMQLFCFFSDLHELRAQASQLWRLYKDGTIGLMEAALSSNAAIALVEQMEKELVASLPSTITLKEAFGVQKCDFDSPYTAMIGLLSRATTGREVLDPAMSCTRVGRFIFADIGFLLGKLGQAYMVRALQQKDLSHYNGIDPRQLVLQGWLPWPRVPTIEALLLMASLHAEDAVANPGFGELQNLDALLTPILMDTLLHREQLSANPVFSETRSRIMDEATRVLMLIKSGTLYTVTIFACALLVDANKVLEDMHGRPYQELQAFAGETWDKVKYATFDKKSPTPKTGHVWLSPDSKYNTIIELCKMLVIGDPPFWSEMKRFGAFLQPATTFQRNNVDIGIADRCLKSLGLEPQKLGSRQIALQDLSQICVLPDENVTRIWVGNAIACGTMMYNVALAREQAGISLANYHLSVLWTGYLYAAAKEKKLMQGHWLEIERVIDTHLSAMFFGSIPPTPTKMYNAFMMRLGLNPAEHTKRPKILVRGIGGDRSGKLPLKKAAGSCLSISDTASLFKDWLNGQARFINTIHAVNGYFVNENSQGRERKRKELNPLLYLEAFCEHVMTDCERFSIDYITLVRDCSTLLQALLDTDTIGMSPEAYDPANYGLTRADGSRTKEATTITSNPVFVHLVRNILWEDKEWEQAQREIRGIEKKGHGVVRISWIERAAEFCQQYLETRNFLTKTGYVKQQMRNFDLTPSAHEPDPLADGWQKGVYATSSKFDENMVKQAQDAGFTVFTELPKSNAVPERDTESEDDVFIRNASQLGAHAVKDLSGKFMLIPHVPGMTLLINKDHKP